jgi:hypothetical protein
MNRVLWLLVFQGLMGAFDTFYYHEWRAQLPARGALVAPELKLHAARSFIYSVIYCLLPCTEPHGLWAVGLAVLFIAEIIITLVDFRVEVDVRKPLGGLYHGERTTHALIGIAYGAMLAYLVPILIDWGTAPTALVMTTSPVPEKLRIFFFTMTVGSFFSGARDLYAAFGLPYCNWPWPKNDEPS